mgnify:CR=1 FL=1
MALLTDNLENSIKDFIEWSEDKQEAINALKEHIHRLSKNDNPVDFIKWVKIEDVQANDYNPNSVAQKEMKLLYTSISEDWYTQPVVTIFDEIIGKYVIVDGFHRYFTMKSNEDLLEKNQWRLPIVILKKTINERMAATVRHNRARGKHNINGMANMVFSMLDNWWDDADICNKIWLESEELLRLKHVTWFSKLFENVEYKKAWKHRKQIEIEKEWKKNNP